MSSANLLNSSIIFVFCCSSIQTSSAALVGTVSGIAGKPLPNASVTIYRAGSYNAGGFCNRNDDSIGTTTLTDEFGKFAFDVPNHDTGSHPIYYGVVIVAKGFRPAAVRSLHPSTSDVHMVPVDPRRPIKRLTGRVTDQHGKGIVNATVWSIGYCTDSVSVTYGIPKGVPRVVVTGSDGRFSIPCNNERIRTLALQFRAPGYCPQIQKHLEFDVPERVINMYAGASVTGVILNDGKPLRDVLVGSVVRGGLRAGSSIGEYEAITSQDGRFSFRGVPPNSKYVVYGKHSTVSPYGTITRRYFDTPEMNDVLDLGNIDVQHDGYALWGRVVTSDEDALPANSRFSFASTEIWDPIYVSLADFGAFSVRNVPKGLYRLSPQIPTYRLSRKNESLDTRLGVSLIGKFDDDTELRIHVEKGIPISTSLMEMTPEEQFAIRDLYHTRLRGMREESGE